LEIYTHIQLKICKEAFQKYHQDIYIWEGVCGTAVKSKSILDACMKQDLLEMKEEESCFLRYIGEHFHFYTLQHSNVEFFFPE